MQVTTHQIGYKPFYNKYYMHTVHSIDRSEQTTLLGMLGYIAHHLSLSLSLLLCISLCAKRNCAKHFYNYPFQIQRRNAICKQNNVYIEPSFRVHTSLTYTPMLGGSIVFGIWKCLVKCFMTFCHVCLSHLLKIILKFKSLRRNVQNACQTDKKNHKQFIHFINCGTNRALTNKNNRYALQVQDHFHRNSVIWDIRALPSMRS